MIPNQGFVSKRVIINHLFMDQKLHAAISISYKLNSSEHAKIKFHWKHFLIQRIQKHFAVITPFVLLRKLLVWREIAGIIILIILSDILNFELAMIYKIQVIKQGFIQFNGILLNEYAPLVLDLLNEVVKRLIKTDVIALA